MQKVYGSDGHYGVSACLDSDITKVTEPDLHYVLREEMSARGWGIQQLADQIGVRYGVAARWLTDDRSKRVVPQPRTLMHLAQLLDMPPIEILRHAGYAPNVSDSSDPDEQQIQSLQRRLRRIIRAAPSSNRAKTLALAAAVLDWLQILADRFLDD